MGRPDGVGNIACVQAMGPRHAGSANPPSCMHLHHHKLLQHWLQAFDVVIEASGSSQGIVLAGQLTRPMGTILLKSTCSALDSAMPKWTDIANDVVVNEKRLQGSRCALGAQAGAMNE